MYIYVDIYIRTVCVCKRPTHFCPCRVSQSYVERLKMMLLREEFFPLVEEVKNSVSVMTKAANGRCLH